MKTTVIKDPRTVGLLHRVSDDVSQLKSDIGLLLGDTTKRAIPDGAREISKITRQQLAAGGAYARSHLPKVNINSTASLGILGGAFVVGALAIGYYFAKDHFSSACAKAEGETGEPDLLVSPHN